MKKKWEDCPREDLAIIPQMKQMGFTPDFSYKDKRAERVTPTNPPHDAVSFNRGNLVVWKAYRPMSQGSTAYWQTAILVDLHYCDHKPYNTTEEMLTALASQFTGV